MSDKSTHLTRRTVLVGMGAAGAGAALGGAGTLALFTDEERFPENRLVAGELDLKVDWQQLYWGKPGDEVYGAAGRPYVAASPDSDEDGKRDPIYTRGEVMADPTLLGLASDASSASIETAYRNQFLNLPDDNQAPVVALEDVKPGDSGCLNMSLHLFDNPGYIWMGGDLIENAENGQNEPELAAEGEDLEGIGELADAIDVSLFYDEDGDCEFDSTGVEGEADVMLVLDTSGSMDNDTSNDATSVKWNNMIAGAKGLVNSLGSNAQVGLVSFAGSATMQQVLTTDKSAVTSAIDGLSSGGTTNIGQGVQFAHEELTGRDDITGAYSPSGNDRDSAAKIMVVLTNGNPSSGTVDPDAAASAAKDDDGVELFTIAYGSDANATLLASMASEPEATHAYLAEDIGAIEAVFAQIGQIIAGETMIFEGSLAELLDHLATGIPLDGNRATVPTVVAGDGGDVLEGRDCFVNSTTNYIAMHWELPLEVGNEIQSDSVAFDLSFYTEQCRHNDGIESPFDGGVSAIDYYNSTA